ncbi:MAG: DUF3102 domain-containing protein [Phycisphaerae bacterium]|nr:DUF3102 domain-containing protein [Phycisphaerae bacterium]
MVSDLRGYSERFRGKSEYVTGSQNTIFLRGKYMSNIISRNQIITNIQQHHELGCKQFLTGASHWLEAGKLLIELKERTPHGLWIKTIEDNFDFSGRTVRRYIGFYEKYKSMGLEGQPTLAEIEQILGEQSKLASVANLDHECSTDENPDNDQETQKTELEPFESDNDDDDDYEPETSELPVTANVVNVVKDRNGMMIQENLKPIFETCKQYNIWRNTLNGVKAEMDSMSDQDGFKALDRRYTDSRFKNVLELLTFAKPYCVCPVCGGDGGLGSVCGYCQGNGWITKRQLEMMPKEYKNFD